MGHNSGEVHGLTCFRAPLDIQHRPEAPETAGDAGKVDASAGPSTASLDQATQMRLHEARMILNVKEDDPWEKVRAVSRVVSLSCSTRRVVAVHPAELVGPSLALLPLGQNYEHLFQANSPPAPTPTDPAAATETATPPPTKKGKAAAPTTITHSHYLQSKVYRALERLEAERKLGETDPERVEEAAKAEAAAAEAAAAEDKAPESPAPESGEAKKP